MLDPAVLDAAARRAERLGVGGDEVLRAANILTPEQIAAGVAAHLRIEVDPLDGPLLLRTLDAACVGVLLQHHRGKPSITVAARGTGIRWLAQQIAKDPDARGGLRIAAPELLAAHVREIAEPELLDEAVLGLKTKRPDFSAATKGLFPLHGLTTVAALAAAIGAVAAPTAAMIAAEYLLALCFLSWTILRVAACLFGQQSGPALDIAHRNLPIYTIIVPLYREAAVAAKLVQALRQLRYPREKLDIKLVLEQDDAETRAEVAKLRLHAPFEVVIAPRSGPQTKPKALAAALPFARGSFVTIYDAEDEPEPDQLHKALAAFASGPPELACVQAKLAIYNPKDTWFSRQFTAEYAGQFEVLLPALARLKLPLPLGGTSNHFRKAALLDAGGWDPFNVTEDADLGIRLARLGYRTGTIDSTTWEEAPLGLRQWLHQRTRWLKGWAQTYIVHMRFPLRAWRDLGTRGFLALQVLIGGSFLSALVHPIFMLLVAYHAISGELLAQAESVEQAIRKTLAMFVLIVGYLGTMALGLAGLRRRNLLRFSTVLLTIPAYWFFLSIAAWRALYQLAFDRYRWEKTEHGLARSTLRTAREIERAPSPTRPVREFVASRPTPRRL